MPPNYIVVLLFSNKSLISDSLTSVFHDVARSYLRSGVYENKTNPVFFATINHETLKENFPKVC